MRETPWILDVDAEIAPLLVTTNLLCQHKFPPIEAYQYLPATTFYEEEDISSLTRSLPGITSLSCDQLELESLECFPSLERMDLGYIDFMMAPGSEGVDVKWPLKLKALTVYYLPLEGLALRSLPSLTSLGIMLSTRSNWSVLASTLVSLVTLEISLRGGNWYTVNDEPLAPLLATRLERLTIRVTKPSTYYDKPFLDDFFGNDSPLPTSITALTITNFGLKWPIPLTVIPSLPRQLRQLMMTQDTDWTNANFKTPPHVAHMTPSELLSSLPPLLECLELVRANLTDKKSFTLLAALPRSLKTLNLSALCDTDWKRETELFNVLPRRLVFQSNTGKFSHEWFEVYEKKIRPYLYNAVRVYSQRC